MGAVAAIFPKFTRTWVLPKQLFITLSRETELCFSHNLGLLRRRLFLKTGQSQSRWLPLHNTHLGIDVDEALCCSFWRLLCCVFVAIALMQLLSRLLVDSILSLVSIAVFYLNQSLKSREVAFTQFFGQWPSPALFKSYSLESGLKTEKRV